MPLNEYVGFLLICAFVFLMAALGQSGNGCR